MYMCASVIACMGFFYTAQEKWKGYLYSLQAEFFFLLKFEDITKLLSLKWFDGKIIKIILFVLMQKSHFSIMH